MKTLEDVRYHHNRTPVETLLCLIRYTPEHLLEPELKERVVPASVLDWLAERKQFYALVADWLAHWYLGFHVPQGEIASAIACTATAVHKFIELCQALWRKSSHYQQLCPEDYGAFRLAGMALISDFYASLADSGVGFTLGLPGFPPPLEEGKVEGYNKRVTALRRVGLSPGNRSILNPPKRGRPKGTTKRRYPQRCVFFHKVIEDAFTLAKTDQEFRTKFLNPWLKAASEENTFCHRNDIFQVGVVTVEQFRIGSKGMPIKLQQEQKRRGRPRKN